MKNDIKLQILVSDELHNKLMEKILKTAILSESKKVEGVSAYVRKLIEKDVEKADEKV